MTPFLKQQRLLQWLLLMLFSAAGSLATIMVLPAEGETSSSMAERSQVESCPSELPTCRSGSDQEEKEKEGGGEGYYENDLHEDYEEEYDDYGVYDYGYDDEEEYEYEDYFYPEYYEEEEYYEDEEEKPFDWDSYDEEEHSLMYVFLGLDCPHVLYGRGDLPLPTPELFEELKAGYLGVVGEDVASPGATTPRGSTGFRVPYKAGYSEGRGRGVFAAAPVPKGTLVYGLNEHTLMFRTGKEYRDFLRRLPEALACEVMIWTSAEFLDAEHENDLVVGFEADDGCLTNGSSDPSEVNVDINYVATRDIAEGEEFIEDYSLYHDHGWARLGL